MLNLFLKSKNSVSEDYSNYTGLIVIYLLTAAIAATVIVPNEDYWYFGIAKSLVWPLYLMTKFL